MKWKRERMGKIEKPLNEQTLLQYHSQMKSLDFFDFFSTLHVWGSVHIVYFKFVVD